MPNKQFKIYSFCIGKQCINNNKIKWKEKRKKKKTICLEVYRIWISQILISAAFIIFEIRRRWTLHNKSWSFSIFSNESYEYWIKDT